MFFFSQITGNSGTIVSPARTQPLLDAIGQRVPGLQPSALPERIYVETDPAGYVVNVKPVDMSQSIGYYDAKGGNVGRIYAPLSVGGGKVALKDVTGKALGEVAGKSQTPQDMAGEDGGYLSESAGDVSKLLKTDPDKAYFWSGNTNGVGGAERALEIAEKNGGITLEGLIESKGIKMPQWDINNPDSIKAWEDVSAIYANQVSGEVHAVVGSKLRPNNTWENVELKRLMKNQNVTKIITIDPQTLVETIIFLR